MKNLLTARTISLDSRISVFKTSDMCWALQMRLQTFARYPTANIGLFPRLTDFASNTLAISCPLKVFFGFCINVSFLYCASRADTHQEGVAMLQEAFSTLRVCCLWFGSQVLFFALSEPLDNTVASFQIWTAPHSLLDFHHDLTQPLGSCSPAASAPEPSISHPR